MLRGYCLLLYYIFYNRYEDLRQKLFRNIVYKRVWLPSASKSPPKPTYYRMNRCGEAREDHKKTRIFFGFPCQKLAGSPLRHLRNKKHCASKLHRDFYNPHVLIRDSPKNVFLRLKVPAAAQRSAQAESSANSCVETSSASPGARRASAK